MADKKVSKSIPTVYPVGYGFRVNDKMMIVMDFFDMDYDDNRFAVGSFALDLESAKSLIKNLNLAIEKAENAKEGLAIRQGAKK